MRALRIMGLLTAGFGAVSIARPGLLAGQLKQNDVLGEPQPAALVVAQTMGVRDLVSGLSLVLLPSGPTRTAAVVARVAFDLGDALLWPQVLPDPGVGKRVRAAGFGWGGLCALAYLQTTASDLAHRRSAA